ncbi:hypothetical protein [Agrobacterium burrii]
MIEFVGTLVDTGKLSVGTVGAEKFAGHSGSDLLIGGHGNDVIDGDDGNDTYVYARGDGHDTITDSGWGGYSDRLVFTDINPAELTLVRNGNDVTIVIAESTAGAGEPVRSC